MRSNNKTLCAFAEDIVYSFKGHSKTADWIRMSKKMYLVIPILGSMFLLIFNLESIYQKSMSLIILLFSFLAFGADGGWSSGENQKLINGHMHIARKYESLYCDIRILVEAVEDVGLETINEIKDKKTAIDNEGTRLPITVIGRWWSKLRIKNEKDISWIKECLDSSNMEAE